MKNEKYQKLLSQYVSIFMIEIFFDLCPSGITEYKKKPSSRTSDIKHIVFRCFRSSSLSLLFFLNKPKQQQDRTLFEENKKKRREKNLLFGAAKELTRKLMMMVSILRPKIFI